MDTSLLHLLNDFFARHDVVEDPVVAYVNAAELLFLGMLVVAFAFTRGVRRVAIRRAAVAAGLSAGVALALAHVIGQIVDRPRPFVTHPDTVHLFTTTPPTRASPATHRRVRDRRRAAAARARVGLVVLALATVLAIGRVAMAVHYPTDVLGGAALGTATALVLFMPWARTVLGRLSDAVGAVLDRLLAGVAARARAGG